MPSNQQTSHNWNNGVKRQLARHAWPHETDSLQEGYDTKKLGKGVSYEKLYEIT